MNGATNGHATNGRIGVSEYGTSNVMVRTTEGWLELFLTTPEKYMFSQWKETIHDKSFVHWITRPMFERLALYIPDTIAPNLVSLFGLLWLGQAWYLIHLYGQIYPTACTWLAVVHLLFFFTTNSTIGVILHKDTNKQRTALGDLFKYSCDATATTFVTMLTTYCLGGSEMVELQWYAVQSTQLVLFLKHLSAFHRNAGLRYNVFTGPGEVLSLAVTLLIIRATFGLDWIVQIYQTIIINMVSMAKDTLLSTFASLPHFLFFLTSTTNKTTMTSTWGSSGSSSTTSSSTSTSSTSTSSSTGTSSPSSMDMATCSLQDATCMTAVNTTRILNVLEKYESDPNQVAFEMVMYTYYILYLVAIIKTLRLKHPHGWSRFGLSVSLLMRLFPAIILQLAKHTNHHSMEEDNYIDNNNDDTTTTTTNNYMLFQIKTADVICDGIFLSVLTSDITLAKMAGREVHPWIVLMSMAAVLSHSTILTLCMVYYIAVFADLCSYLNMPLLTTCKNVYCDGIYDLCHVGHKLAFQNALQFGNRLLVGVINDQDANSYKRSPIMTHEERCAEVQSCKAVTKVIPNAPCFGITKQFLDDHQIHIVAFGQEYLEKYPDPNDDPYYKVPRLLGIAKPLPRTQGLSTSDLIRRIQQARPADEKASPT